MEDSVETCICLLTAHRLEYAKKTIRSAIDKLNGTHRVHIHIASDGDDADYLHELRDAVAPAGHALPGVAAITASNSEGQGYGANWNKATQVIHQIPGIKYVMVLEDDWECLHPFDLDQLVRMLEEGRSSGVGCIRLGYLGFTDYLHCTLTHLDGVVCGYLLPGSPEKHVFAGHPRIETIGWEKSVGPWPEQEYISNPAAGIESKIIPTGRRLNPGETELAVCEHVRNGIVWPFGLIKTADDLFAHIGTDRSY